MPLKNNNKTALIIVAGPTAVGKTKVAIQLARHYNTVILSADSRQIYKELSIGTAKPTAEELSMARHYFIGTQSVTSPYNAGEFEREAHQLIEKLADQHQTIIVAGGTGLYIKALCEGLDEMPDIDPDIRISLNNRFKETGLDPLLDELQRLDPAYYEQVDRKNPRRIIRALEVCLGTGKSFSSLRKKEPSTNKNFRCIKIGLERPREELYERINQRVDDMISAGLLAEAEKHFTLRELPALQTVGYSELFAMMEGKHDMVEAIRLIKRNTRRYAKRQLTWFKNQADYQWFHPGHYEHIRAYADSNI